MHRFRRRYYIIKTIYNKSTLEVFLIVLLCFFLICTFNVFFIVLSKYSHYLKTLFKDLSFILPMFATVTAVFEIISTRKIRSTYTQ